MSSLSPDGSIPVGMAMAYNQPPATSGRAVWWPESGITVLQGTPPYWHATSEDASNNGVVGWGQIGDGSSGDPVVLAFRASGSSFSFLSGLNTSDATRASSVTPDGGMVVGTSGVRACVWTGGATPTALERPDAALSERALSISADGRRIVGTYRDNQSTVGVMWVDGTPIDLPIETKSPLGLLQPEISLDGSTVVGTLVELGGSPLGFSWSEADGYRRLPDAFNANAVSADGSVIGGTALAGQNQFAALWINGETVRVSELLESLGVDLTGWSLGAVTGVSADGLTIAGTGTHWYNGTLQRSEGWVAVIPGPCGAGVLVAGFVVTARRRR